MINPPSCDNLFSGIYYQIQKDKFINFYKCSKKYKIYIK